MKTKLLIIEEKQINQVNEYTDSCYFDDNGAEADGNAYIVDAQDLHPEQIKELLQSGATMHAGYVLPYSKNLVENLPRFSVLDESTWDCDLPWCGWSSQNKIFIVPGEGKIIICSDCGNVIPYAFSFTRNGEPICEDCFISKEYVSCVDCDDIAPSADMLLDESTHKYICRACVRANQELER